MLKTISPLISPTLLKALAEMGHGDEIIFSDAHFPAQSLGPQVIRADGLSVSDLLRAIIPLFELDSYAPPLVMMAAVEGDTLDPSVETRYRVKRGELFKIDLQLIQDNQKRHNGELFKIKSAVV